MPNGLTGDKRIDINTLGTSSIILSEYDEDTQRDYLLALADLYKNAKIGDPLFHEICQGRAEGPAKQNFLFSTCGEFAMFLLHRAGYRGPCLNRDVFDVDGKKIQSWAMGQNISYIFNRGRKQGLFTEYLLSKQKDKRPSHGDIIYISNNTPNTEHVFMFKGSDTNPYGGLEIWDSVDGGQGGNTTQHISPCSRVFNQKTGRVYGINKTSDGEITPTGEGRAVVGWLNMALVEFSEPANLCLPT